MLFARVRRGIEDQVLLQLVCVVVYLLALFATVGQQSGPQVFQLLVNLLY